MTTIAPTQGPASTLGRPVRYPDSDGMPIAENTLQFEWIVVLKENLDVLLPDFVAGDLLWYPVEGDNRTRVAPDVLVALGRPKGYRGSYKQWEEGGQPPQVVFEVLSPGNRLGELYSKYQFYDRFGVDEYYTIDPERNALAVQVRRDGHLVDVLDVDGFVSPLLGIRVVYQDEALLIYAPNGERFLSFRALKDRAEAAEARLQDAEAQLQTAEARALSAEARAEALAARLRALGLEP